MLCKKVSDSYLWSLVTFLLEGLVDYQAHSSSGACVVLNNMVKLRGSVLSEQVPCSCVHVCNIEEVSDVWVLLCTHMFIHAGSRLDRWSSCQARGYFHTTDSYRVSTLHAHHLPPVPGPHTHTPAQQTPALGWVSVPVCAALFT